MTAVVVNDRGGAGAKAAVTMVATTTMTENSSLSNHHIETAHPVVNLSEEQIQTWLDTHKGWFQLYAIENLDANTVEKWLRSNGKRVCKCKNPSAETMLAAMSLSNENSSLMTTTTTATAMRGKRNSIAGICIPVIDDITGKDLSSNDLKRKAIQSPDSQENITNSTNAATDSPQKSSAAPPTHVACSSNFSSCLIHNRKSWYLTQQQQQQQQNRGAAGTCGTNNNNMDLNGGTTNSSGAADSKMTTLSGKKFSFVYEEESTGKSDECDEEENSNGSEGDSSTKSSAATGGGGSGGGGGGCGSPTIGDDGTNLKTSNSNNSNLTAPQSIIWTPGSASKRHSVTNNSIRKYHSFHTGVDHHHAHHHHNPHMHHHHHHHYHHHHHQQQQQSSSLSALKFLIKSKIKLPHAFSNHSSGGGASGGSSGNNTSTIVSEKIRIKYDETRINRTSIKQRFHGSTADHVDVKLLLDAIKDIEYELDLKRLSEKIVANVKALVNADKASLFFVCHARKRLASFKFDPHTGIRCPTTTSNNTNNEAAASKTTTAAADMATSSFYAHNQTQSSSSYGSTSSSTSSSTNNTSTSLDFEFEIPFENTILGAVARSGDSINISNVSKDARYDSTMDKMSGYQVKSLLCMPIKNANREVIAVVQAINKLDLFQTQNRDSSARPPLCFNEKDIRILDEYLQFCAISISNSQLFDFYIYECERNRSLIEVLHDLFEQQTNLDTILFRIMQRAQTLLKCQRCSILLNLNNYGSAGGAATDDADGDKLTRKAFDLFQSGNRPGQRRHSVEDDDGSKISRELADYVIQTGEKINLADAYSDPRFDPLVDTVWRFKTKGILCMPIRNRDGQIIGCANIANRLDDQPFDEADEELFEAFCIFCGLGIANTLIYNKLEKSMAEKVVALEVLSYHATCSKSEFAAFMGKYASVLASTDDHQHHYHHFIGHSSSPALPSPPTTNSVATAEETVAAKLIARLAQNDSCLTSYLFNDFSLDNDEMIVASYEMFKRSGLMRNFHIDKHTLFQWLLTVKKNYRNVEYHNWRHAFNVCQNMFAIFENSQITSYLQDIEKLALLVGCLCHDLDHRGTNNMFQVESHSALCQLYGTTGVLEKHHFNHCVMILNTSGHNIFSNIKPRTYGLLMSYIKEAILATDLAEHFIIMSSFQEAVQNKDVYWNEEPYCSLLRKNLMTFCDLASVSKPWPIHKKVVNLVTKEFFAQGDRERLELNKEPNEMMDARRYHELPRLQIAWIDNVCLPLYSIFTELCPSFNGHLIRIKENRQSWFNLIEKLKNSDTTILDEVD